MNSKRMNKSQKNDERMSKRMVKERKNKQWAK